MMFDKTSHPFDYSDQAIAIIGIACEFAGPIHSPKDLWNVLDSSIDLTSDIPSERFEIESLRSLLSSEEELSQRLIRRGYFLDNHIIEQFDPKFFGMTDKEALIMDPCHRILLQKFVHLCEDAGYSLENICHTKTGVFIAQSVHDHQVHCARQSKESQPQQLGLQMGMYNASSRIAYHFDLHGPNMTIDAACSSSLTAVQLGVTALRNRDAEMVVVGGTQLNYAPESFLTASKFMACSPDGRSRAFSIDANGFAKSDGIGLILLKRLSDAVTSGDHIYCVIHDSITKHDGSSGKPSYTVPSPHGQYRMLNEIYSRSNIDPKQVFYVECHGTGTKVGDPIEANTLGKFFSRTVTDPPLLIGSVKSNIGHTESTAGIASLIKIALCMRYRCIPPNMNFSELDPNIHANKYNIHVVTRKTYFPPLGGQNPTIIGISGYGVGGTGAHCIVLEWMNNHILSNIPKYHQNGFNNQTSSQGNILTFSAKSDASLRYQAKAVLDWFAKGNIEAIDEHQFFVCLSRKLLLKRTISFDYRVSFISQTLEQFKDQLTAFSSNIDNDVTRSDIVLSNRKGTFKSTNHGRVAFIFSGQGPQWWGMGRQLYHSEPVFRQWIDRIDKKFQSITKEWKLIDELLKPTNEQESRINETNIAQPALFAIQVALAAVWYSWNIYPSAIIGHSMGEVAAVFVARRITLIDAVNIIFHRARLQHRNTRQNGRMLAVGMSESQILDILDSINEKHVSIAAVNSEQSVTLSGDADMLQNIKTIINNLHPKVFCAWLRVENAFHSYQMDRHNIREDLQESLKYLVNEIPNNEEDVFYQSSTPFRLYSTVTGCLVEENHVFNAEYWWQNIRQPVQFYNSIRTLIQDEKDITYFLEISPHPVLATSLSEILPSSNINILASLKRKHNEQTTMLAALSQFDLSVEHWKRWLTTRPYALFIENDIIKEQLWSFPGYQFDNILCWYETKQSVIARRAPHSICHPLLGVRLWNQIPATWINKIDLKLSQFKYFYDHRVQGEILLAGACFIEIALAAGRELADASVKSIILENFMLSQALVLDENEITEIHTIVTFPTHEFRIYSRRSKKDDFVRKGGMASNDLLDSFSDKEILDNYSIQNWKLHAKGTILFNTTYVLESSYISHLKNEILTKFTWNMKNEVCKRLYTSFDLHGYGFGSTFQRILAMQGTKTLVMSEIENIVDTHPYSIHPTLIDACFQSAFAICPKRYTFVPVSFGKITIYLGNEPNCEDRTVHGIVSARPIMHGFTGDDEFTFDAFLFSSNNTGRKIITLEDVKIQKISEITYDSCTAYFDQLDASAWLPGRTQMESKRDVDIFLDQYIIQPVWLKMMLPISYQNLMSPYQIFSACSDGVELRSIMEIGNTQDDVTLFQFITEISCLIRQFLILAFRRFSKVKFGNTEVVYDQIRNLMSPIHQLYVQTLMEYESTQQTSEISDFTARLEQATIMQKYPMFRSTIEFVASCGSCLFQILTGELDALQWMFEPNNQQSLYEFYGIITKTNMVLPVKFLFDQLSLSTRSEQSRLLRILEIGGGTGGTTIHIIECLLEFSNATGCYIEFVFTDVTSALFNEVQEHLSKVIQGRNERNLVRISYDILDLDQSPLLHHSVEPESFDIVFAINVVHVTKNVVNSLQHIRHYLVPGGLSIMIEITRPCQIFDFLFGLMPQWWVSSLDDPIRNVHTRSIIDVDRWREAFDLAKGYDKFDFAKNTWGQATIAAQKASDMKILNTLPERKEKVWVIFCFSSSESDIALRIRDHLKQVSTDFNIEIIHFKGEIQCVQTANETIDLRTFFQNLFAGFSLVNFIFPCGFTPSLAYDTKNEFLNVQEELCVFFLQIIQHVAELSSANRPKLFVLTLNAQNNAGMNLNPMQAPIIGFLRSFQAEYQTQKIKLIDIQTINEKQLSSSLLECLVAELCAPISNISSDHEITLTEIDQNKVIRSVFSYDSFLNDDSHINDSNSDASITIQPDRDYSRNSFGMELPSSHFFYDMKWVSTNLSNRSDTLDQNQILVRVHCVGLNFRDLLMIQDSYPTVYPFGSNRQSLPSGKMANDFSGTIIHVGSKLKNIFTSGDRVCGTTTLDLAFSSHLIVNPWDVVKVPSDAKFTFEELASIPITFCTVLFALKNCMELRPGKTCLIHSAAGGVGLTSIQYCQLMGVHVIATAGTEEKRQFLRETYRLEHVFNSRDLSFVDDVRKIMPNGVDIIINSLAGPFLTASLSLLASHGHFIELGKRDTHANTPIGLFNLREHSSFHVVDILSLYTNYPEQYQELLKSALDHIIERKMHPIEKITVFEPAELITALETLKKGSHIGKLILRITESNRPLTLSTQLPRLNTNQFSSQTFDHLFSPFVCEKGTILLTGGLGSIGLAMTSWMIKERGVKSIILLGRQKIDEIDQSSDRWNTLTEVQHLAKIFGASVEIIKADVANFDQVDQVINYINNTSRPLCGIIHGALILHDCLLAKMTPEILKKVLRVRIRGAWNLHQATISMKLRFFILLSSARNHHIDIGGANYNASNQFYDTFAHWRYHVLNLPTLSVNLSATSGTKYFQDETNTLTEFYRHHGVFTHPKTIAFELMEMFYQQQYYTRLTTPIIYTVDWTVLAQKIDFSIGRLRQIVRKKAIRMQAIRHANRHSSSTDINEDDQIESMSFNLDVLTLKIKTTIAKLFGSDDLSRIDIHKSLTQQGMDSLMAVSLHNWLAKHLFITIPMIKIVQGMSIMDILDYIKASSNTKELQDENHQQIESTTISIESKPAIDPSSETDPEVEDQLMHKYQGINLTLALSTNSVEKITKLHPVLFCFTDMDKDDAAKLFSIFAQQIEHFSELCIVPSTRLNKVQEYIIQLRRVQPCGPYYLLTHGSSAEICLKILEKLKQHQEASVKLLLMLHPTITDSRLDHCPSKIFSDTHVIVLNENNNEHERILPDILPRFQVKLLTSSTSTPSLSESNIREVVHLLEMAV